MPGQKLATEAAHQLPRLSELSQQEVVTDEMGHPVLPRQFHGKGVLRILYPNHCTLEEGDGELFLLLPAEELESHSRCTSRDSCRLATGVEDDSNVNCCCFSPMSLVSG